MTRRLVVISGCSGGGKSTLLDELRRRGHAVVDEPGRRIVQEEVGSGGSAVPWIDLAAFAWRAIELATADLNAACSKSGFVFFDRGLVDAACALEHATGEPVLETMADARRYHSSVFLAPPWPEIYAPDPERRHGFDAAVEEYDRLEEAYPRLGYEVIALPKTSVVARADFVMSRLMESLSPKAALRSAPQKT